MIASSRSCAINQQSMTCGQDENVNNHKDQNMQDGTFDASPSSNSRVHVPKNSLALGSQKSHVSCQEVTTQPESDCSTSRGILPSLRTTPPRRIQYPFSLSVTAVVVFSSGLLMMDALPFARAQGFAEFNFVPSQSIRPSAGPSLMPSGLPSLMSSGPPSLMPSLMPSGIPSLMPSGIPSLVPSTSPPSLVPSDRPTQHPTVTSTPSTIPSAPPTMDPTRTPYPSNSVLPTEQPSFQPSEPPTEPPSLVPSISPTDTFWPSLEPSASAFPSGKPTESPHPTASPSSHPTITAQPTGDPTLTPSVLPSWVPSDSPTVAPTFDQTFKSTALFFQSFTVLNGRAFNDTELDIFETILEGYTQNITSPSNSSDVWTRINATCEVGEQRLVLGRRRLKNSMSNVEGGGSSLRSGHRRDQADSLAPSAAPQEPEVVMDYTMNWSSNHVNVTNYQTRFIELINSNLNAVTMDLRMGGLNVSTATRVRRLQVNEPPSVSPTNTRQPSFSPSQLPSLGPTHFPTGSPSIAPTSFPTKTPTTAPSSDPSMEGMSVPSLTPASTDPTPVPTAAPTNSGANTTVIAVVVVGVILAALAGAYIYTRHRKKKRELAFQTAAAAGSAASAGISSRSERFSRLSVKTDPYGGPRGRDPYGDTPQSNDQAAGMISPSESLLSNQSLLSAAQSMGVESVEEADGTHHLADEFDQYKDQNLEKMRNDVEDTVTGADGMMSHALTLALMGDESQVADQKDLYWGGTGDATEIEASALCEVNDFLKRKKDGAGLAERRTFMQDTMNKMVASVRHGVMKPDQASRTIHECAAMLGLELASEIPENTVIVTGMRKNVTKSDLEVAFREFGDIDEAAVASLGRGLGLVRFVSTASVQRTMKKFRDQEIVVQDVAIMVKVLKADGMMAA